MDRTDKLINNREPRRMLLMFAVMLILTAGVWYLLSGVIADASMSERIRGALAFYGGQKFTEVPAEDFVNKGESLAETYGITADMNPKLMGGYQQLRMKIFRCGFGVFTAADLIWLLFGLSQLFHVYSGIESVRRQCLDLSERFNSVPQAIGDDMSCVRRLSDSVSLVSRRLELITSQLTSAQNDLADFLTDLSHQLKTSLAVIRLNSDILAEIDDLPQERREQLSDELTSNIDGMEELVLAALKLAKLDAGAVKYEMKEQSLAETCGQAVRRIAPLLREKGIASELECPDNIAFPHDRTWICEAVENIIKNAADHAECSQIRIEAEKLPSAVRVSISDNGKGIAQEEIPLLFERFGRATKGRNMTSVGIGLSIARKIAVAHSGEITVYSEKNKGTRFEMLFIKNK